MRWNSFSNLKLISRDLEKYYVGWFVLTSQNTTNWVAFKQQKFISCSSGSLKIWVQGASRFSVSWGHFLTHRDNFLVAYLQSSSEQSLIGPLLKGTNPIQYNNLTNVSSNTIILSIGFQHDLGWSRRSQMFRSYQTSSRSFLQLIFCFMWLERDRGWLWFTLHKSIYQQYQEEELKFESKCTTLNHGTKDLWSLSKEKETLQENQPNGLPDLQVSRAPAIRGCNLLHRNGCWGVEIQNVWLKNSPFVDNWWTQQRTHDSTSERIALNNY
jgi:hypothetical protein